METNRKKVNSELPKYEQLSKIELVQEEFEKKINYCTETKVLLIKQMKSLQKKLMKSLKN